MKDLIFRKIRGLQAETLLKIDFAIGVFNKVSAHRPPPWGCLLVLPSQQIYAQSQQ